MENIKMYPYVTAMIVTRNEEMFIRESMMSLIVQTYPHDRYEIIVVDGTSTDNTLKIVNEIVDNHTDCNIRVMNNNKKILAAGWNIGIKAAKGDYIVRIDAHAKANSNFIEKSVETILRLPDDVVCVGGHLITQTYKGSNVTVSKVLSSQFGVGNSLFRISDRKEGYADTAVYGLYKRSVFEKVGYFNEEFVRNQDIELHSRIKRQGGKFYFNPEIESVYYSRNTVKKMAKQALVNGKWNMILMKNHCMALSLRHLVPFAFVSFLTIAAILGFINNWFWKFEVSIIVLHLILGVLSSLKKTRKLSEILIMPIMFMTLHISYGVGYLVGIFYNNSGKKTKYALIGTNSEYGQ
jgi:cellulose synthase/poly-beta-1,6-N-acetylglucosamine synthase-like glycosyltransferase